MTEKASVFLNGRFVGFHDDGASLAIELRDRRRRSDLPGEMNVSYSPKTNEIFINTDEGRTRRPLIVVKKGKSFYTPELQEKVKKGEVGFNELVKQGIIEYLDAEEEEDTLVAMSEPEIVDRTTHLEVDLVGMLGVAPAQIPFPEYNSSPRVLMASQHTKQALGLYAANFNQRTETRGYVLHYPQKPLVRTRVYENLELDKRAAGQNLVVAVLSYYGMNMHDATVINRASVERGLGRSTFLRSYGAEERRYPGGQKDKFCIPEEFVQGYLGEEAYKYLDTNGLVSPETGVQGDSVLVGKTSPPRFLKEIGALDMEVEKRRESSVSVRGNEAGIVDAVMLSETTSGNKFMKVRVRTVNIPEIGDKFASRFGQKGVVSLLARPEDMPFTKDGVVPDLIINPLAIPGRMTAGHLLEMLAGKAACLDGQYKNGTAFHGDRQEDFEQSLRSRGFRYTGEEVLYDGRTGRTIKARIFIGVIYYQRLHHLVSLKMHARSRGPVQMLTHQPTEGRAREGGLRLGEMERDCFIGYGAASLLKERMIDSSDRTTELVCTSCGSLAVWDKFKNRQFCGLCESTDVSEVEMSYAFKLLLDEMKSIHIFPKLRLKERG